MITLAVRISPRSSVLEATYLEVTQADIPAADAALMKPIFTMAKQFKRHVGMVIRQYGGNTYFSYDPDHRAQLEIQLLNAAISGSTEVHIQASNGEVTSWNTY